MDLDLSTLSAMMTLGLAAVPLRPLFNWTLRIDESHRAEIRRLEAAERGMRRQIRATAKASLQARREISTVEAEIAEARGRQADLLREIKRLNDRGWHLFHRIETSRRPDDREFGFVIRTEDPDLAFGRPGFSEATRAAWRRGRRFIQVAADAEEARQRIAMRYPGEAGFVIEPVEIA